MLCRSLRGAMAYLPRGCLPASEHLVGRSPPWTRGAAVGHQRRHRCEDVVAAWSIPGRSRGRTVPADPTSPTSWTAVTAGEARCAGRCEGARHRRFFRLSTPGFLRKRCGRPMLPEVRCARPSIDLPSLTLTRVIEHVCENLWCGVLRTRTETVPARAPTGTAPGSRGLDTVHLRDSPAPLGSDRTPHLSVHRLRGGNPHSAPHGATVLRGAVAAETDARAAAARLGR
ncbi:hypothetical protein SAMN04490240_0123 [Rhodococcus pyridinivorans]|nr:hypothetical protein SAMN04490240_0123 [Rhodococcus pyridinivorans]